MRNRRDRPAWTIIEILLYLGIFLIIVSIILFAINPDEQLGLARNERRRSDIELLADAIDQFTRDSGETLLFAIPKSPAAAVEICSDIQTGSCTNLLSLNSLLGRYLNTIPIDPSASDPDLFDEHSRYFIQRDSYDHIIVTAPDTEVDVPVITARR